VGGSGEGGRRTRPVSVQKWCSQSVSKRREDVGSWGAGGGEELMLSGRSRGIVGNRRN